MGEFDYINRAYGLSIKRGTRVEYTGEKVARLGTVTSSAGAHINIRFDDDPKRRSVGPYHPTWELRYFDGESPR